MSKIRHVVIFRLYPDADKAKAIALLQSLGEGNADILEWKVRESLDTRKGIMILENGLFKDVDALVVFVASEKHREVGEQMRRMADWWIVDYEE